MKLYHFALLKSNQSDMSANQTKYVIGFQFHSFQPNRLQILIPIPDIYILFDLFQFLHRYSANQTPF